MAERLIAAGELYGDDVTDLLDGAVLRKPAIDVTGRGDMARDLIPPPSPAGRPAPDPEHPPVALAAEPDAAPAAEPAAPPGPSAFRARFGFLMGALAGCAVAAAVLLVVLISGDGKRATHGRRRRGPRGRLVAVEAAHQRHDRGRAGDRQGDRGQLQGRQGEEADEGQGRPDRAQHAAARRRDPVGGTIASRSSAAWLQYTLTASARTAG